MQVLGAIVGVVVLDLVVVPGQHPWVGRVRGLQIGITLVERVADPVVVERVRLGRPVRAHVVAPPRGLVDVVADVDDHVEVVRQHVAIRGEEALLVLLAGGDRDAQAIDTAIRGRRGARSPDGAHLTAGAEAIPVPPAGVEPIDLDVHGVRERRLRAGGAALLPGILRVTGWGAFAMALTAIVGKFFGAVA